jgi:RNase H-fold protein (predicted Holliday junction resolvase)
MSAAEIIEQIKELSAEDKAKVAEFLRDLAANRDGSEIKYVDPEKASVIADRVFEENADLFRKLAQ